MSSMATSTPTFIRQFPGGLSACPSRRGDLSSRSCKRKPRPSTRKPVLAARGTGRSRRSGRRRKDEKDSANTQPNASTFDFPPLGPTPSEVSGFEGWREEDDEYWRDFRERELSFRAPTTFKPEDLESPPQPLGRDGKPSRYPAAVRYDVETKSWIPTPVEEEEALKKPHPSRDPYFIPEAEKGEKHTSMRNAPYSWDNVDGSETKILGWQDVDEVEPDIPQKKAPTHKRKRLKWRGGGWKVFHLGTSSAVPTRKRNVSSTAFLVNGLEPSMFLVDAGEDTNRRLLQCDWCMTHGFRWIRAIFITHLHGDHIYGLPMLLRSIGRFAQHRRRAALENGDDGSDPVIRIFGPYGTRGFVRSSLYWTIPVGVRFSVSELVPRDTDFLHIRGNVELENNMFVASGEGEEVVPVPPPNELECPPPHPEEVRADDIQVGDDGLWHVWEQDDENRRLEVVSAPLKHRLPCFGYVFREPEDAGIKEHKFPSARSNGKTWVGKKITFANGEVVLDMDKARRRNVWGSQFKVLRQGRSVHSTRTNGLVEPEDVAWQYGTHEDGQDIPRAWCNLKVNEKKVEKLELSLEQISVLQRGHSIAVAETGAVITPEDVSSELPLPRDIRDNLSVAPDVQIDFAKALSVGLQEDELAVLNRGDAVVSRKTGRLVKPEDVEMRELATPQLKTDSAKETDMSVLYHRPSSARQEEVSTVLNERAKEHVYTCSPTAGTTNSKLEGSPEARGHDALSIAGVESAQEGTLQGRENMVMRKTNFARKVTILGDTCDSSLIGDAARGSDLLVHEATFTEELKQKAKIAMHSTARMAGAFGRSIEAKKLALTHFSSRHEMLAMNSVDVEELEVGEDDNVDFASPNQLVKEARQGFGSGEVEIVAAYDFMEHDFPAVDGAAGSVVKEQEAEGIARTPADGVAIGREQ